jgi:enoyl-CoA hydratase/carnithine racemase
VSEVEEGAGGVIVRDEGAVRLLTLNRPAQRNAFTVGLYDALSDALWAADHDEGVRAVVVTGAGSAFSAGTDLGELAEIAAGRGPARAGEAFPGLVAALADVEVPLVAAVNGPGVGVGATMLPYFDLVFIAESARLKAPFADMGVPPEAASSFLLPMRMGWQRAARMLFMAEWLDAADAVSAGLATAACPSDKLLATAMAAARSIAAHERGATRSIKALMRAAERQAVRDATARERDAFARLFGRLGTAD